MSPFLYPLILILYSEFSPCNDTKWISRVLFYIYAISLFFYTTLPPVDIVILLNLGLYLTGYGLVYYKIKHLKIRVILIVLGVLQCINHLCLYNVNYTIYYMIPYYFEYSNLLLRELTVMCICSYNYDKKVGGNLRYVLFICYVFEYYFIIVY